MDAGLSKGSPSGTKPTYDELMESVQHWQAEVCSPRAQHHNAAEHALQVDRLNAENRQLQALVRRTAPAWFDHNVPPSQVGQQHSYSNEDIVGFMAPNSPARSDCSDGSLQSSAPSDTASIRTSPAAVSSGMMSPQRTRSTTTTSRRSRRNRSHSSRSSSLVYPKFRRDHH